MNNNENYRIEDDWINGGWVIDSNGNRATIELWGSEAAAIQSLKTLKNCWNCWDCEDCENCRECEDCRGCKNCYACSLCDRLYDRQYYYQVVSDWGVETY